MKNLLSVSAVFDSREYLDSSVEASFPYPYTFLLSQGEYICSPLALPRKFVSLENFTNGVGFATRAEAEKIRKTILASIADADLMAIVHRITGVLLGGAVAVCDCPNDAVVCIRNLEKDAIAPESFSPIAKFTTKIDTEVPSSIGCALYFEFQPSKRYYYDIQLVERIPASSAVTPLLDWDAIGIK